ncbi:MAG TPA: hypothetical protein PK959_02000 [Candidatus Competibacteraceae bacterium]|nr:hypothetical protein [Candidatus Competibacteraceae bacterium]
MSNVHLQGKRKLDPVVTLLVHGSAAFEVGVVVAVVDDLYFGQLLLDVAGKALAALAPAVELAAPCRVDVAFLAEHVYTDQAILEFVKLHRRHLVFVFRHRIVSLAYSSSLLHYYKVARQEAKGLNKILFGITYT